MGAIKDTTDATFEADVLQNDKTVLVDFWAPWCGPCRAVAPILEELAVAHADKIEIVKLNTDENLAVSSRYGITGIPTSIRVIDGYRSMRLRLRRSIVVESCSGWKRRSAGAGPVRVREPCGDGSRSFWLMPRKR